MATAMEVSQALTESSSSLAGGDDLKCGICENLYTDARTLSCGHDFCFTCLYNIQNSSESKACLKCTSVTIPPKDELTGLVPHMDLNAKVGKAMLQIVIERRNKKEKENDDDEENNEPHTGTECSICHRKDFTGSRYVCGHCKNVNLCSECEAKSATEQAISTSPGHAQAHLFIKLRRPVEGRMKKAVLRKTAPDLSKVMDFADKEHAVTIGRMGNVEMKKAVGCDKCKCQVIIGVRYKCGMCSDYNLCEKCVSRSDKIHDKKHLFVKIPHPLKPDVVEDKILLPGNDWMHDEGDEDADSDASLD